MEKRVLWWEKKQSFLGYWVVSPEQNFFWVLVGCLLDFRWGNWSSGKISWGAGASEWKPNRSNNPQLCSRVALSSPIFNIICYHLLTNVTPMSGSSIHGNIYTKSTQIANSPSPWLFATILSKSWIYLFGLHLLLFSVPLGVDITRNKGSTDWPTSVKGAVSWGLVTSFRSLRMGGTLIIFFIGTHLDKVVTLKDNRKPRFKMLLTRRNPEPKPMRWNLIMVNVKSG